MTSDSVRDDRTTTFASEATAALQNHGFPCRVDASGGQLGVYASRRVRAGERIAVERPLALTVNRDVAAHTCATCLADSRDASQPQSRWTRRCSGCGTQQYCSEACEAAGQQRHGGIECEALAALGDADDELKDQVAQAVRIVTDKLAGRSVDAGPAGRVDYSCYASRLVGVPPRTPEAKASLSTGVSTTLRVLPERVRPSAAELHDMLMRHQCNLYGVTGRAGEDKASASFVGFFHLFNHACNPNVVFDSATPALAATPDAAPLYALVALTDVPAGKELCISYTSTHDESSASATARAAHLEEWYGFRCGCERCSCDDPLRELDFDDALDELRCERDECGSGLCVPPEVGATTRRCVHCGVAWGDEEEADD